MRVPSLIAVVFLFELPLSLGLSDWLDELNLHPDLLPYFLITNPELKKRCEQEDECKKLLKPNMCVGFESECVFNNSYSAPHMRCNLPSRWSSDSAFQFNKFLEQGDFGYIKGKRESIKPICTSKSPEKSEIHCSAHLEYCTAKNIFFNLRHLHAERSKRYRQDVILEGDVGGNCDVFDQERLREQADYRSYLQSWADELLPFENHPDFQVNNKNCDVIFERPTVIIKLDAAVNMYHHFCDFVNLFASQFINGSFSTDIDILWWDTATMGFVDSYFGATWKAFSRHNPVDLISLDGKKICFKNAVLPLLARMRLGLFYNTPLIEGCQGSGLMHAFAHHILHRLRIHQLGPLPDKIRITMLSRSTQFRKMLNEKELFAVLENMPDVEARIVDYNGRVPFLEQLHSTHNSDIFIGMHGSGLTHLLFLPDWATIFEIYNCDDVHCYLDLARLRGIKYYTWTKRDLIRVDEKGKHPQLGTPHEKFANYMFDPEEFKRIVLAMIKYVRSHPKFVEARRQMKRKQRRPEDEL